MNLQQLFVNRSVQFQGLGYGESYGYQPGRTYDYPGSGVQCPPGSVWDGESCVIAGSQVNVYGGCPPGMRKAPNGQCITTQSAGGHGDDVLATVGSFFSKFFSSSQSAAQPQVVAPVRTPVPTWVWVLGGAAVVGAVALAWRKPMVALAGVAVGAGLVVVPKVLGVGRNPFAGLGRAYIVPGTADDSV